MSGIADVFLVLGAAVVKASVRVWFKDEGFASDTSASIVDFIQGKISGDLEQRQARRFFEDLEVPVAKRIRAMCATEFRGLPENEWNAAVLAAGDSFDRTMLTAADLFSHDLDPLSLERQVRLDRGRAVRDLSLDGTGLYDRLVSEGCAFVIEIADKLPRYQLGAFAELLKRDRQILELIYEVLDRIPASAVGQQGEERFSLACRRNIATRLDRLELLGLDFESGWYPLSVAYVSLRTDQQIDSGGRAIEERLAGSPRSVLVGRAGSGKTTVLQWLAVRAARSDFTGTLTDLNGCFPFLIRLREYVGRELPQPEEFLAASAPLRIREAPDGWFRSQLDSGRALVLVDGVDELPADERNRVTEWVRDLVQRFPSARYVITARPTAAAPNWLADSGFAYSSLEAMPPSLVQDFVRNWHEAARRQLTENEERESLDGYERSLLADIESDRYLRDLADTPLLAGLLCALNRHLRSNLPRRRSEIYERALAMLDQRDYARRIASDSPKLDLTAKTQILADLALWMTRNGESEADANAAAMQVGRSLARLRGIDLARDSVFGLLLERSGLLRETAVGRIDFVHRTFQEYLAARAAVDGDVMGELVRNADNDQWGEVVVLAAGQANQTQAGELLGGLLRRNWRGQHRHRRRILAVACLQEVRGLDPDLRQEVESVVPSLLPPQSMEQAEQLSGAGKLLIPLLARYWMQLPSRAPETIRAASLVGGQAAMDLIRDVMLHERIPDVTAELARAWQYFETGEYVRSVLMPARIKSISIADMSFLRALTQVSSLENLQIESGITDLELVAKFPHLKSLLLTSPVAAQLPKLTSCPALTSLTIFGYRDGSLSRLPSLPGLTHLGISSDQALNLTGIELQRNIVEINIYGCKNLVNIRKLSSMPRLDIVWISRVRDLDLTGLRASGSGLLLYLSECNDVDLSPLAGVNGLTIRYDKGTRLRNAEMLGERSMLDEI